MDVHVTINWLIQRKVFWSSNVDSHVEDHFIPYLTGYPLFNVEFSSSLVNFGNITSLVSESFSPSWIGYHYQGISVEFCFLLSCPWLWVGFFLLFKFFFLPKNSNVWEIYCCLNIFFYLRRCLDPRACLFLVQSKLKSSHK